MRNDVQQADQGTSLAAVVAPPDDVGAAASTAYRNLVRHIDDLALVVLHAAETAVLRDAADACVFDDEDAVERVARGSASTAGSGPSRPHGCARSWSRSTASRAGSPPLAGVPPSDDGAGPTSE